MSNILKSLTEKQIKNLIKNGKKGVFSLGIVEGLSLRIRDKKVSYVLRYRMHGVQHMLTLGDQSILSLSEAKKLAMEKRLMVLKGIDPLAVKRQQRNQAKQKRGIPVCKTFKSVAYSFINERQKNGYWKYNSKNGALIATRLLDRYVFPAIGSMSVNSLTTESIYSLIAPIWSCKTNTAQKVLTLVKQILNWTIAHNIRKAKDNPADLKSSLGVLLEPFKYAKRPKQNHAAARIDDVPELIVRLHKLRSPSARAVEFAILTAARSAAVRLAEWNEFDLQRGTWTVPLEHDKSKMENRSRIIYLNKPAVKLLKSLYRYTETTRVFCSYRYRPLSDMSLLMVLRRLHREKKAEDGIGFIDPEKSKRLGKECVITVHGTARACFKTWAKDDRLGNNRKLDQEAVELCLLHCRNDSYNGAYDRSLLQNERRLIMDEWGKFCTSLLEKLP